MAETMVADTFVQFYESEIAQRNVGVAARIVSIPSKAFPGRDAAQFVAETFGDPLTSLPSPDALPWALALTLGSKSADDAYKRVNQADPFRFQLQPEADLFLQRLAYEPLIPVERSPLTNDSLAQVILQGVNELGPHALGTVAGIYAAGPHPLVIISVPIGIILVGAARGVAAALEEGLRERISGWLGIGEDPLDLS